MLSLDVVLTKANTLYAACKRRKGLHVVAMGSDQIQVLAEVLVQEINKELEELEAKVLAVKKMASNADPMTGFNSHSL